MRKLASMIFLALGLAFTGCTEKDGDDSMADDTAGDGDGDTTGDGDGDGTGDGDGDTTGDGDGDGDTTGDGDGDTTGDGDGDPSCPAVGVCAELPDGDDFELHSLTLDGDCLTLEVSYGGGCEDHDFSSCWDQSFAESEPVQAWLWIDHDAHEDPCDALIRRTLSFDLSVLREAWQQGYQSESGTIVLHVAGQSIHYNF